MRFRSTPSAMADRETPLDQLSSRAPWLLLGLAAALFVSIRLQLFDDEVPNPDISGILYNADGLLRGELPYVDNAELKPVGSFYVVAAIFSVLGRDLDVLQWAFSGWLLLGVPAIVLALPGRGRTPIALAVGVYLYYAGMFTYNYTAWMMPVYAWAFAGIVRSLERDRWTWGLLGGMASAVAFGFMQRAGVLGPLALALWLLRLRTQGPAWRALGSWVGGALLGAALMALPYIGAGEVATLLANLLPWALVSTYSSQVAGGWGSLLHLPEMLADTFGGALVLVTAGLLASRLDADRRPAAAALFIIASIVGTGLGGARFYVHYMPQLLPALAVAVGATRLGDWIDRADTAARRRGGALLLVGAVVLCWVYAVSTGDAHRYEAKARRLENGKSAAQAAGAHIRARTDPDDTIYGWGWTAWRVYFWADRRAPGRYYKALGRVTTFNSNTAFDPGGDIVFTDGPHAEAFIADFDAHPPSYFVLSPSFVKAFGAEREPLQAFTALAERLQRDYRPEAEFGDLLLLRRIARP